MTVALKSLVNSHTTPWRPLTPYRLADVRRTVGATPALRAAYRLASFRRNAGSPLASRFVSLAAAACHDTLVTGRSRSAASPARDALGQSTRYPASAIRDGTAPRAHCGCARTKRRYAPRVTGVLSRAKARTRTRSTPGGAYSGRYVPAGIRAMSLRIVARFARTRGRSAACIETGASVAMQTRAVQDQERMERIILDHLFGVGSRASSSVGSADAQTLHAGEHLRVVGPGHVEHPERSLVECAEDRVVDQDQLTGLLHAELHDRGSAGGDERRLHVVLRRHRPAFLIDVVEHLADHVERAGEVRARVADEETHALADLRLECTVARERAYAAVEDDVRRVLVDP